MSQTYESGLFGWHLCNSSRLTCDLINRVTGFPRWLRGKETACQCKRSRFDLWVGKIPWRRKLQPTPVFLPGNPQDRRAWWAIVYGVAKELDMTMWLNNNYKQGNVSVSALLLTPHPSSAQDRAVWGLTGSQQVSFSPTDLGTGESPDSSFYTSSLGSMLLMLPGASVFPSARGIATRTQFTLRAGRIWVWRKMTGLLWQLPADFCLPLR